MEIEQYYLEKQAIESLTNSIEVLRCKEGITKNSEEVIELLKEKNLLYEQKVKTLQELIKSISKERDKYKEELYKLHNITK